MENLNAAIDEMDLDGLNNEAGNPAVFKIEPTKEEIKAIISALKNGKSYKEIKKTIRRFIFKEDGSQKSAQGFSFEQIMEIDGARKAKIMELNKPLEELPEVEIL